MSKSPSLRRIQADVRELALDPSDRYHAAPLEDDMFEWHFTIRGAEGTDFEGGLYHGRILLPPEYPFKPPHIMFLTPSGRFETNTKICLSFSAFHPELWQPAWGIRLILEALIAFLPSPADGAIGALDWTPAERKRLAIKSKTFCCHRCGKICDLLPETKNSEGSERNKPSRFEREIEALRLAQAANESKNKPQKETAVRKKDSESVDFDNSGNTSEEGRTCPISGATNTTDGKEPTMRPRQTEHEMNECPKAADDVPSLAEEIEIEIDPPKATSSDENIEPPKTQKNEEENAKPAEDENTQEAAGGSQGDTGANDHDSIDMSPMTDVLLNGTIVLLVAVCYLLARHLVLLQHELKQLQTGGNEN